jgi:cyanate permease
MSQTTTFADAASGTKSAIETATIRAISWRLIPFLMLAYFFSYLDRVNLGFAALTMNADLKFTPLIFSWGAGIFFIGYFIFEVPSNLALEKFGASRWIARIMVTWGIISALMAVTLGQALSSPKVITLSLIYFGFVGALYGMQFWLPQIVKAFGLTNAQTGFVTAIPYLFGAIAMILWARHSDATRERVMHVGAPLLITAVALGVSFHLTDPMLTMVALTFAAIGVFCCFGVFWTLPTAWLSGTAAAGAIALINSIGNLAGFGGPYLIGWVKEATGQTSTGLLVLAILPLIAAILVFVGGHDSKHEFAEQRR